MGTVFARHYLHAGMDIRLQKTGRNDLPENYVSSKWALGAKGTTVTWRVEANVRDRFVAALATWTAAVPQLRWAEETTNANANVLVKGRTDCRGMAGYFDVYSSPNPFVIDGWEADSDRSANYWRLAVICLKLESTERVSDTYYQAVAAHEIGHAYGLHDAYKDDPVRRRHCNGSVISIMDGYRDYKTLFGRTRTHCDDLDGPSSWDVARVRDFWLDGGLVDFTSMAASSTVGIVRWRDDAWGELRHEFDHRYRLDGDDATE